MSKDTLEAKLEEIRARVDIVELIGARLTLKKSGATYKACCPFHHEKTPSFHVNPAKQFYHCFGCKESGDIFTFIMKQDGLTFYDAVRRLAERAGVTLQADFDPHAQSHTKLYALNSELAAFYQRCLNTTKQAAKARQYLQSRHFDEATIQAFGIGFAPHSPYDALQKWAHSSNYTPDDLVEAGICAPPRENHSQKNYYDRLKGRLVFPIWDRRGRVVAFSARILESTARAAKYVNSAESAIFIKSHTLYALDRAASKIVKHPQRQALICEGQLDVIRCHAAGFETAVAALGTAFTQEHVHQLKRFADCVVLLFDGDSAGRKAAIRTGALFLAEGIPIRAAKLPPNSDPDSLLVEQGTIAFTQLINEAPSIITFLIESLQQLEERPDSIDAVNRMATEVIEMLAQCPTAILRAHLLQEAATLLKINAAALEADLAANQTQRSRRAPPTPAPAAIVPKNVPTSPIPSAARPPQPSKQEWLLCEFMIEHEHNSQILLLIERYLPLTLFQHPLMHQIASAIITQHQSGEDELAELQKTVAPQWHTALNKLLLNPLKMMSARDISSETAVCELITALWIKRLQDARGALPAECSSENDHLRFPLTHLIKRLQTQPWAKNADWMTTEHAAALMPGADLTRLWTDP